MTRAWLLPALLPLLLLAACPGCDDESPARPSGSTPQEEPPQISAEIFALTGAVEGGGVRLAWIWPEKDPYAAVRLERQREGSAAITTLAAPFAIGGSGWLDEGVANGAFFDYRLRCTNAEGEAVAVTSWSRVEVGTSPALTLNGGRPVAAASPVRVDLLATQAEAMRFTWDGDLESASWLPVERSFSAPLAADGAHLFTCQVRDPGGTLSEPITAEVFLDTTMPVAAFLAEVSVARRSVLVDADPSRDGADLCPYEELRCHWSWGDGTETSSGTSKEARHTYTEPGPRTITLTVTDWAGHQAQTSVAIDLSNRAPAAPVLLAPECGASGASRLPRFQWSGASDPEDDAVSYLLCMGTAEPLPAVAEGLTEPVWDQPAPLAAETVYQWRVVARDALGAECASETGSFLTAINSVPAVADAPYPENWQERVSLRPRLTWRACLDPEGAAVVYDLYFGESLPLALAASGLTEPSWQPGALDAERTYLWRVHARDPDGAESLSRTWRFETGRASAVALTFLDAGGFVMGAADAPAGAGNPPRGVQISRPFWLGESEVTCAVYADQLLRALARRSVAVKGDLVTAGGRTLLDLSVEGCRIARRGQGVTVQTGYEDHPVVGITWFGAAAFCDWLNDAEGLPPSYAADGSPVAGAPTHAAGYRLPTEAEWEYATQAGGAHAYPWGDEAPSCAHAVYDGCADGPAAAGSVPPAPEWSGGLFHDLAGNAAEWCQDWWQDALSGDAVDPAGPGAGERRVVRGGGFDASGEELRCAARTAQAPEATSPAIGFRVARTAGY